MQISRFLNERTTRLWVATESQAYGYGGIKLVYEATGIATSTIRRGIKELDKSSDDLEDIKDLQIRHHGGGRKKVADKYPELVSQLDELIEPATRGDPENPLRWSSKSTIKLTKELNDLGYKVGQRTVYTRCWINKITA